MSIHKSERGLNRVCAAQRVSLSVLLSVLGLLVPALQVQSLEPESHPPRLQRVKIDEAKVYLFDFDARRGPAIPAFVELEGARGEDSQALTNYYYLFGTVRGANTKAAPLRWDMANRVIFCTHYLDFGPSVRTWHLMRFPITALIAGPDDGRDPLDRAKLDERSKSLSERRPPNYISLTPIAQVYLGVEGWKEGDELMRDGLRASRDPVRVLHYDVRALDDVRAELFMTANGRLSRWLYDGDRWKLKKNYSAPVTGPFLVCDEGAGIVMEQDERWCLMRDLEDETPLVTPIAEVAPGEVLVLIEDLKGKVSYFQHAGAVYDHMGTVLARIPTQADTIERTREVVKFVQSLRK